MRIAVVYQSRTGNTKLVAEEIYKCLRDVDKVIIDLDSLNEVPEADFYFLGFGVYNGNCSIDIINMFEELSKSKYALFVSCGLPPTEVYKQKILKNIEVWLPEQCELIDSYMCQGKMDCDTIESMISKMPNAEEQLREIYKDGLSHPNELEFKEIRMFVKDCLAQAF